jgi:hypothetical protein
VLPTAGVLLALLALMSARPVVVVVAFGVLGAALAPAALAVSGRRPPPLRCLSVCLILCASVVALGESIDSISTSVLAATAAGLLMGLGGLVVATSGHGRSDLGLSS